MGYFALHLLTPPARAKENPFPEAVKYFQKLKNEHNNFLPLFQHYL